uniref:TOPBP1 interacting checkpoint and replication regulator n=1 Tax=Apteryx owenii TaxID=8824 RepID=A0A8B9P5L2_APTOW
GAHCWAWDRPEIASPAKPLRRSRRTGLAAAEPPESLPPPEGFVNAIFLFSPCPHSRRELRQFVSGSDAPSPCEPPTPQELAEKLLPKGVQELIADQKITLYWVDTAEWSKLLESPDHVGYWTMFELIHQTGGTILSSEILMQCLSHHRADLAHCFLGDSSSSMPQFMPWTTLLPLDSTLNFLFSKPSALQAVFPQQEGMLFLSIHGEEKQESCVVILEPLAMSQRQPQHPVNIFLKGTLTGWNLMQAGNFLAESWILRSSQVEQAEQNRSLFHQLLRTLVTEELHMVNLSVCPEPISILKWAKAAEVQRCNLEGAVVQSSSQDHTLHLPDIVNSVLSKIDTSVEESLARETPVPEWVQQELSRTGRWHPSVLEAWYPSSNICGASSNLMESFRYFSETLELSESLSEMYQRKSSEVSATAGPGNNKKRRGLPRTPVRQKMKTMSRSLQMLNVARLNVKAQKFQPDGVPPTVNEKVPQKLSAKRLDEKLEEKEKAFKISIGLCYFKTEEELLSHLIASYQKAVAEGVISFMCAQSLITAIKRFLKIQDAKEREVACVERVRSHLLKTSKTLRQQHGSEKETKVRECRLQVFLRLELCLQCPSLQSNTDEMEHVFFLFVCLKLRSKDLVQNFDRVLCYMESIPKTLGDLYYSLGTQIPPKLASVLPSDFFSDDSVTLDSKSPALPHSLSSALTPSTGCPRTESDQLEELRTRSAKKRRNNVLARHRSMTEAPQNLRQIEIPKIAKNPIRKVKLSQKDCVEVTKVRRNLFNEDVLSPRKRSMKKMPRSQSVSAVEGLRYKCTDEGVKIPWFKGSLLTKRVAETPLHKQISRRLLHKQIKGRLSDPGSDTGVVEESPEKTICEAGLRRSPRIKQLLLNRTHSGIFYSTAQPCSQNKQQVHPGQEEESCTQKDVAVLEQNKHDFSLTVFPLQTPKKTPPKAAQKPLNSASKLPRRSPRNLHRTPEKSERTPGKSPAPRQTAAKCLGKYFSHPKQRVMSPSVLMESKRVHLLQVTCEDFSPIKRFSPSHKEVGLRTPEKEGLKMLSASSLPLKDSNQNASSTSAFQERSFTDLQTPGCSFRSISKSASPVGARRQILPEKKQMQSESAPLAMESTPRKLEDPGSKLHTSPLRAEISQLTVRADPPFNSPLCANSTNALANSSPSHTQTREFDWELNTPKASLLKLPGITGTSLRSPLHAPEQSKCEPNFGGENLIFMCATPSRNKDNQYDNDSGSSSREQSVKEGNSSANTCESFLSDSQTSNDDLEPRTVREGYTGLKAPSLKRRSRSVLNALPAVPKSASAYSLRCTADRRQREAAARLGNPEIPAKFSTPKSHCKLPSESPPTYEVELEMQASGLPKLRFKKIGSCSALEVQSEANASKPKGGESPFGDLAVTWCSKHPEKLAAACVSPSCFRSFHSTPGKGGGQTYICQSYTPTNCASNTTSPSPLEAGVPCTPSPKQKGKTTPDAIKDWPRRKRAASSTANASCAQSEKNADETKRTSTDGEGEMKILEHCSSKVTNTLGEFELEGVCRLQDQPSPSDSEPRTDENTAFGTFDLKSRKRVFTYLSPEKEEKHEAKRSCTSMFNLDLIGSSQDKSKESKSRADIELPDKPRACSLITPVRRGCVGDDNVFLLSGSTPPVKSALSASSLLALTQSPLLCQGQTPSWRKCAQGNHLRCEERLGSSRLPRFAFCMPVSK